MDRWCRPGKRREIVGLSQWSKINNSIQKLLGKTSFSNSYKDIHKFMKILQITFLIRVCYWTHLFLLFILNHSFWITVPIRQTSKPCNIIFICRKPGRPSYQIDAKSCWTLGWATNWKQNKDHECVLCM